MGRRPKQKPTDKNVPDGMVCYICNKKIKNGQRFYSIGKNKKGVELHRHLKCKPYEVKDD